MKNKLSQIDRLYNLLLNKNPHRTDEILKKVYGSSHLGIARISARIYDVKKKYGVRIECERDKKSNLYYYQML